MIWFLRHGESTWNAVGRMQGHTAHPPLTDRGRAQAAAAAEELAGQGITRVLTSPAVRARQTADIVAARLGVKVDEDPDLVEKGLDEDSTAATARIWALLQRLPADETLLVVTHGDVFVIAVELLTGERIPLPDNCQTAQVVR